MYGDATIAELMELRKNSGVGSNEGITMIALSYESMMMQDIGKITMVSRAGITTLVDRLEYKGFVSRGSHPKDRRVNVVSLTQAGADELVKVGL